MVKTLTLLYRLAIALVLCLLTIAAGLAGYHLVRSQIEVQAYRTRLAAIASDYEKLRVNYNAAVRKAAITELVVKDNKLSVTVRSSEGVLSEIQTPYDPAKEIHVDYIVVDGRIWARRVYDDNTPATQGTLIDPKLADIAWDEQGRDYGLTIYRPLTEGRWVVNLTSNGSLTLTHKPLDEKVQLVTPPPLREFETVDKEVSAEVLQVGPMDVLRRVLR